MKANEVKINGEILIFNCGAKWNSVFFMLNLTLKFRTAFDWMAEEENLYNNYFHEDDTSTEKN